MLYDLLEYLKEDVTLHGKEQSLGYFLYLPKEILEKIATMLDLKAFGNPFFCLRINLPLRNI
jgi:hypothetical protein